MPILNSTSLKKVDVVALTEHLVVLMHQPAGSTTLCMSEVYDCAVIIKLTGVEIKSCGNR